MTCDTSPSTDELMAQVATLNVFQIIPFLEKYPELKHHAAIVRCSSIPVFFAPCHGVKDVCIRDAAQYKIKILEFGSTPEIPEFLMSSLSLNEPDGKIVLDVLDELSFVFVPVQPSSQLYQIQQLRELLDERTHCHWRLGLPTFYRPELQNITFYEDCPLVTTAQEFCNPPWLELCQNVPAVFESISFVSLNIDGVTFFKSHSFPLLRWLKLALSSPGDGTPPIIQSIKAPLLLTCIIHYSGVLPVIQGVTWGDKLDSYGGYYYRRSRLEVVNTASSPTSLGGTFIPNTKDQKEHIQVDRSTFTSFRRVFLHSTPQELLYHCDFTHCIDLDLYITKQHDYRASYPIALPELRSFSATVLKRGASLPFFTSNSSPTLGLYMTVLAPEVNLHSILSHKDKQNITHFYLYRSPKLFKLGYHPFSITHKQFFLSFASLVCQKDFLIRHISLVGMFMPFLTTDSRHGVTVGSLKSITPQYLEVLILRPVISSNPNSWYDGTGVSGALFGETNIFCLDVFVHQFFGKGWQIHKYNSSLTLLFDPIVPSEQNHDVKPIGSEFLILPCLPINRPVESTGPREFNFHLSLTVPERFGSVFIDGEILELKEVLTGPIMIRKIDIRSRDLFSRRWSPHPNGWLISSTSRATN